MWVLQTKYPLTLYETLQVKYSKDCIFLIVSSFLHAVKKNLTYWRVKGPVSRILWHLADRLQFTTNWSPLVSLCPIVAAKKARAPLSGKCLFVTVETRRWNSADFVENDLLRFVKIQKSHCNVVKTQLFLVSGHYAQTKT